MQLTMLSDDLPALRLQRAHHAILPNPADLAQDRPQETWVVLDRREDPMACASLWWRKTPSLEGRRVGFIGNYATANSAAARMLLQHAAERLAQERCGIAIAPVNGSTWRSYRLVSESDGRPAFFLEPSNPAAWVADITACRFEAAAQYQSTILESGRLDDPRLAGLERQFKDQNIEIGSLTEEETGGQLNKIYGLVSTCFRENFLYSPISEQAFRDQYLHILRFVDPRHVLLATAGEDVVGIAFAIPDLGPDAQNDRSDTLILKTLAVQPGRQYAGLGRVLINRLNQIAAEQGYGRVIHALMREGSQSLAYSRRFATSFRRYALYAKALA